MLQLSKPQILEIGTWTVIIELNPYDFTLVNPKCYNLVNHKFQKQVLGL